MSKRLRHVWRSQADCVDHWFDHVLNEAEPAYGRCMTGWYTMKKPSLSFEKHSLYTHERGVTELARLVKGSRGQWVVLIRKDTGEYQERKVRRGVVQWRAQEHHLTWTHVTSFDDMLANQVWYTARIATRYGYWKRAHVHGSKWWRMQQLEQACKERTAFERAFGLRRTKEEPDVRVARVTQRLLSSL